MKSLEETGVYVHIAFCTQKCNYCDFLSFAGTEEQMAEYVDLLAREARGYHEWLAARTVFVGGGTPSVLPPRLLERLVADVVRPFLHEPSGDVEFTAECNPESLSPDKIRILREGGVNRLSLGVQSFVDRDLKILGRRHSVEQAQAAYELARDLRLDSVNLDLMYGFPGHTMAAWSTTLAKVAALTPEHVSAYCFILEEGTRFFRAHEGGQLPDEDAELQAAMYSDARRDLIGRGYRHYEISNFSLPGHECRHNVRYWRNETYVGLGLGAVSYLDGCRRGNARSMADYHLQIGEGRAWDWIENPLAPADRVRESLMLGLRLMEGVDPRSVPGNPLADQEHEAIEKVLERWRTRGLIERQDDRYALTERGLFLSNEVFADLVS